MKYLEEGFENIKNIEMKYLKNTSLYRRRQMVSKGERIIVLFKTL